VPLWRGTTAPRAQQSQQNHEARCTRAVTSATRAACAAAQDSRRCSATVSDRDIFVRGRISKRVSPRGRFPCLHAGVASLGYFVRCTVLCVCGCTVLCIVRCAVLRPCIGNGQRPCIGNGQHPCIGDGLCPCIVDRLRPSRSTVSGSTAVPVRGRSSRAAGCGCATRGRRATERRRAVGLRRVIRGSVVSGGATRGCAISRSAACGNSTRG
jgi:hypothetical protein